MQVITLSLQCIRLTIEHKFLHFTENGISNLPPIPTPPRKPKIRYDEERDDPSGERGSDDDDDDDNRDMTNPIPLQDQRETRVGTYGPNPQRATRNTNPNYAEIVLDDVNFQALTISPDEKLSDIPIPNTFEQATASRFKDRWIESMTKEITDLVKHGTWELVSIDSVP